MAESTLEKRPPAADVCFCMHLDGQHDAVASRFCAATTASALQRRCICPVTTAAPARTYDRR